MAILKTVDLFCGCGGLSLGFKNASFEVVAAFDNWIPAIKVYQKNFLHPIFNFDLNEIHDLTIITQFQPDMILGGPPCQDFSSAGKRDENLGRGNLTVVFAKIVAAIKPRWFVMENVKGVEKKRKYQEARDIFKSAGYGLTEKTLNASLCGVPQNRSRFFCIGELGGFDRSLESDLEANLASKPLTVREYLGDKLEIEYYYRHPRSYQRRGVFSVDEPSPTIRGVNRPIPKTYQPHPGDSALISDGVRPLTTVERSWIQTFPEEFVFEGSKTDLEQMIGNAVPVKLAEYVARCLMGYIEREKLGGKKFQFVKLCV